MGMWGLTKKEDFKGQVPVTDGVPRSSDESVGFTKVRRSSSRGRARRGPRAGGGSCGAPPPPPT